MVKNRFFEYIHQWFISTLLVKSFCVIFSELYSIAYLFLYLPFVENCVRVVTTSNHLKMDGKVPVPCSKSTRTQRSSYQSEMVLKTLFYKLKTSHVGVYYNLRIFVCFVLCFCFVFHFLGANHVQRIFSFLQLFRSQNKKSPVTRFISL